MLASLAGAVTALSTRPFKNMTKMEISVALIVASSFAIFVGPLISWLIFRNGPVNMQIMGGIFYLMATGSNTLIPLAVKWLSGKVKAQTRREDPR